jgi:transcriptional regulator with XRE-family HTH domain
MLADSDATTTELARRANVAPSTVNRFMNGEVKHVLSVPILHSLAQAAGGRLVLEYLPASVEQPIDSHEHVEKMMWVSFWDRLSRKQRAGLAATILDILESNDLPQNTASDKNAP